MQGNATTWRTDELEYFGEEDDSDVESSGRRPLRSDANQSSPRASSTTSKEAISASPSPPVRSRRPSRYDGGRRSQQTARLSFVRKSPSRMLRPQLTSVSYTVRHEGRRRGRRTSRRPRRRRPRTTTPLPPYYGQTLEDVCPSGRLVVTVAAVRKLGRCLGVDMRDWLRRTTISTPDWSVELRPFCIHRDSRLA